MRSNSYFKAENIETPAIVLDYTDYGERDRMLTLLTPDMGKLSVSSKSCRAAKSPLLACSQRFCTGRYRLSEKQGYYTLRSCSITESFSPLGSDMEKFASASALLAFAEGVSFAGAEAEKLFLLLEHGLGVIAFGKGDAFTAGLYYMLAIASDEGFAPMMSRCAHCGGPLEGSSAYSAAEGGALCTSCAAPDKKHVKDGAIPAADYLIRAKEEDVLRLRISPELAPAVWDMISDCLSLHLERRPQAFAFLAGMLERG